MKLKQTLDTSVEVVLLTTAMCAGDVTGLYGRAQHAIVSLQAHEPVCMHKKKQGKNIKLFRISY